MTDTNLQKYDGVAMLLHWVTAVLMIVMIFFGEDLMGEGEEAGEAAGAAVSTFLPSIHVSIGVTILVLTVLRLLWRVMNPPPPYPAMSRRLGEAGRVVVRVLIGTDGRAQDARIQQSSGYERLDKVALETARDRWRYVPGTRGGRPEAMWFNVPINFVLQ